MDRETTDSDIQYVTAHLRAADAVEQFATMFPGDDTPEALAQFMIALRRRQIVSRCFVTHAGVPAAILSAYLQSPGVVRVHRISTDDWSGPSGVSMAVFRFGTLRFMPAVAAAAHRAECSILAQHDMARRMLLRLGFHQEGLAWKRGRDGEDFLNMAWVKS